MKKNLIYFVIGYDVKYAEMLKICINSIIENSDVSNIDFLVLCDEDYKKHVLPICNNIRITEVNDSSIKSSMRKVEIFDFIEVEQYNKILYLDVDIVVCNNINDVFNNELSESLLYVLYEDGDFNLHNNLYFSLKMYNEKQLEYLRIKNIGVFNCGQFLFIPSIQLKQNFDAVRELIKIHKGEFFYEQSFMNHHFNLKGNTDGLLSKYVKIFPEEHINKHIIHFAGVGDSIEIKLSKMKKWLTLTKNK